MDLYRIFQKNGLPPEHKYLFLGDIIERGKHSFESLTLLLIMKILYPSHIYIICGNHEFFLKRSESSFYSEVREKYFQVNEAAN